jgi:ATP-binding cassette subfamily B protein
MNKTQIALFVKFLSYLRPYRKKQMAIFFLNSIGIFLSLIIPYFGKLAVDKALINKELHTFFVLGLVGMGIFILSGLVNAWVNLLVRRIRLKVRFDLSKNIFKHLQGLPLKFFKNTSTGELMFNMDYDIEKAVDFIVFIPEQVVSIFPKLFLTLIVIFWLDWRMALFCLGLLPVLYLPAYYLFRKVRRILEDLTGNCEGMVRRLQEVFSHMYFVKAAGQERSETRKYLRALISNIRISLKNMQWEVFGHFAAGSLERILIGLIALFGGFEIITGRISVGTLAAITMYVTQLIGLQAQIVFFFQRVAFGLVSCRRLNCILEQKEYDAQVSGAQRFLHKETRIQFRRVSFGYRPVEYIFKDLDCAFSKRVVALAGPSGCGKTTLLNLLLGLYEPQSGTIFINGHDAKELDMSFMRQQIGIALQEPFLWNDTIENNIKYERPNVARHEVMESARLAGADVFISGLPLGYDMVVGDTACNLSEGQKQRIAIARALIKKPKVLIFDEAMSSLDSLSEEKIINSIREIADISLVIIVSHRLSAVLACDEVYFINGPEKIVVDRPGELLKKDKAFYDLFSGQVKHPFGEIDGFAIGKINGIC